MHTSTILSYTGYDLGMGRNGGGGNLPGSHDFGYGRAAGVPRPKPIHILGEVKKQTHSYTLYCQAKIVRIHVLFFTFYLFLLL